MIRESFKFFDPPTIKWRPFNFFVKFYGNHLLMANFSNLHNYQTFGLNELQKLRKLSCAYDYRAVENTFFWNSDFFIVPTLKRLLSKILLKNFQVLKEILKVLIKFYCFTNIYVLKFLDNETRAFCFLNCVTWRKY